MCADAGQTNSRFAGKGVQVGNSVAYFEQLRKIISVNDGVRECGDNIVQVWSSQPPFNSTQKTQMRVFDGTFHITTIDKSYALIDCSAYVRAVGIDATLTDPDHLLKVFVGFKSSGEALRETNTTSNGRETGYKSNSLQYEGFAYSNARSEAEKMRKRGVFSPYENVRAYMPSVCGTYINLVDLKGGAEVEARFEMCIPFTNILVLSFFSYLGKFPSFMADLIFKDVYLGHSALCWALCSPQEVRETKQFLEGTVISPDYPEDLSTIFYEHRFHQIEDPSVIPVSCAATGGTIDTPYVYTSGPVTLTCGRLRIHEWKSHIKGYMISGAAQTEIRRNITEIGGLVFPAQETQYIQFNNGPNDKGLKIQVNTALFNTNSIIVGFPKTSHEITCLQNPCLVGVQMKLNGSFIPNEAFDTQSVSHLQDQVGIANLDGPLNPTKEFENSIVLYHNKPETGARYTNSLSDDTSYLCTFQTERSDSAFVVDGINSNGKNVPIELNASPKYAGPLDTYYLPNAADLTERNQNKPFMLECRDTFWILDAAGLHYKNDATPRGSQTDPRLYYNND